AKRLRQRFPDPGPAAQAAVRAFHRRAVQAGLVHPDPWRRLREGSRRRRGCRQRG
ncbi:MAG: Protein translocase subunit SecY, partial [uncultured Frankineae bacterium]